MEKYFNKPILIVALILVTLNVVNAQRDLKSNSVLSEKIQDRYSVFIKWKKSNFRNLFINKTDLFPTGFDGRLNGSRIKAFSLLEGEDELLQTVDSTIFYWSGDRDNTEKILFPVMNSLDITINQLLSDPENEFIPPVPLTDSILSLEFEESIGAFVPDDRLVQTRNNQDLTELQLNYEHDGFAWIFDEKAEFEYDNRGNMILAREYDFNGTKWLQDDDQSLEYNSSNRLTATQKIKHNPITGEVYGEFKHAWDYDDKGRLTEVRNFDWSDAINGWEDDEKELYTYDDLGNLTKVELYSWDDDSQTWEGTDRHHITYNLNNLKEFILSENFIGNQWVEVQQIFYTYDDFNRIVTMEIFLQDNAQWVKLQKAELTYPDNNQVDITILEWDKDAGVYENLIKNWVVYNDLGQPLRIRYQIWNEDKWTYFTFLPNSNFYYEDYGPSGHTSGKEREAEFTVFPSPARDIITVKCENVRVENIRILDIKGRVVRSYQSRLHENIIAIPVSDLTPGTYFVRLEGAGCSGVKPFVVQR